MMRTLGIGCEMNTYEYVSPESGIVLYALLDATRQPGEFKLTVEIEDWDGEVCYIWEFPTDRLEVEEGKWDVFFSELQARLDAGSIGFY